VTQSKEDDGKIPARQQSSATHTLSLTYVNPAARVHESNFIGKEKKPEVADKRVYRISRKFIGLVVSLLDKIYKKNSQTLYKII